MSLKPTRKSPAILLIAFVFLATGLASGDQASAQTRLATATRRSQNAARTIRVITSMKEDETIPAEFFERAYAIAVFPDVVRTTLLLSQGMKGYGVICSRGPMGWNLPAYYAYGSTQLKWKLPGFKSFDLVLLFMKKDAAEWFQGGRLQLKGLKAGVAGPVGKLTHEADLEMSGVSIIMYALVDGKLKGMNVEADFLDEAILNPDNNINKAVYGLKGREVLLGLEPKTPQPASELTAFRDILNEKFPVSK